MHLFRLNFFKTGVRTHASSTTLPPPKIRNIFLLKNKSKIFLMDNFFPSKGLSILHAITALGSYINILWFFRGPPTFLLSLISPELLWILVHGFLVISNDFFILGLHSLIQRYASNPSLSYRVSHIKLDCVNGSKLRFGGQIRKFKKNELFWKFNKANRIFFLQKMLNIFSIMCVFRC